MKTILKYFSKLTDAQKQQFEALYDLDFIGNDDEKYNYDRPELWEYIQYLPDQIANNQFYVPWMTSQYEKALAENRGKDVLISAFAAADTEVLGPLRLHIYLKNETEQEINHE